MKKKIGLFFGTFNPIHSGHLIIANHMAEYSDLQEIWLVVTPHNPFKKKKSLLDNHHRLEMVFRACEPYPKLKPSNIEFDLPQPNYTINTLVHLSEKFPELEFSLIMGEDNLLNLHKWKNFEAITEDYNIYVYPRIAEGNSELKESYRTKIHRIDAPVIQISSTAIRKGIKEGKNVRPLLPYEVWAYCDEMNFYK